MAQPIDYLIYLRNYVALNYEYYSIENGVFTTTVSIAPTKPINFAPKQWETIELNYSRKLDTKGVFRDMSDSFKFVRDGAMILRKLFFDGGVNAKCEVLIRKFNRDISVYDYEDYFIGSADFSTAINEKDFFGVKLKEAGFLSKYETRKSTKYKIPITDNANAIWVKFDGVNLNGIFKWVTAGPGAWFDFDYRQLIFNYLLTEGVNLFTATFDIQDIGNLDKLLRNDSTTSKVYKVNVKGDIITQKSTAGAYGIRLVLNERDSANVDIANTTILTTAIVYNAFTPNTLNFNVTTNYTLTADNSISLLWQVFDAGGNVASANWDIVDSDANLDISVDNRTKTSYVPCLSRDYVFKELVKQISDNTTTGAGTFLSSLECSNKLMTSGDALRNLPKAQMYISMDEFFETIDAQHGAALHFKQSTSELFLYNYVSVFPNIEIANIGEVGQMTVKPLSNEFYGKLLIGQNDYSYDEVNGKDEFNTTIEMLSPLEGIKTSKSYLSAARHDIYGIEQIRQNLNEKTETDDENDNDVFEIHADFSVLLSPIPAGFQGAGEDYYNLYRDTTLTITNVYSPQTLYNIYFSPRRALLRRGSWERSLLYGNDTKSIKFINSKKQNQLNLYLTTNDGTTTTNEGSDVLISTLASPIFKPFVFEIEIVTNLNLISLLNTSPFGYLTITRKGLTYRGYILEVTRKADNKNVTKIELLATADTNISQLIE